MEFENFYEIIIDELYIDYEGYEDRLHYLQANQVSLKSMLLIILLILKLI